MPFHSRPGFSRRGVAIIAAAAVLLSVNAADSQTRKPQAGPANLRRELQRTIDDAIGTLQEPDYRQFIEYYAPVQVLQAVRRQDGGVNGFADRVARDKRAAGYFKELAGRLRKARKATPRFNKEQTIARFEFIVEPARKLKPEELPFGKIAKKKVPLKGYGGDLPAALDKARAALDGGDYADYLSHMLPETDLRLDDVAKLAKRLKSSPAVVKQMIADYKLLESQTPKLQQKGTIAVFRIPRTGGREPGQSKDVKLPDRVFKFQKVAGNWRLYDNTKGLRAAAAKFGKVPASKGTLVMEKFRDHWRISGLFESGPQLWGEIFGRLQFQERIPKKR